MKTTESLKQQLHSLIDTIEDEEVLKVLTDDIVPFVINSHIEPSIDDNSNMNPEEMAELEAAFKKMEAGEYATMASFREAMSKWTSL
jgi:hypothetical protein